VPKDSKGRVFVVGIGASAGGLEAFTRLLRHLPTDTGMAFVLVQHLDPARESALTDLLSRATSLPVREAANNLPVEPNHVYVIPPDSSLGIANAVLKLQPRRSPTGPHRTIDLFFEALAQDQRERAVGVVLSGTATDGTLGLEAIKAEGGITFAQDDSARYDSMPRSAVAAGCVDFVLKPEDIATELARIAKHPLVAGQPDEVFAAEDNRASATAHADDETALPSGGRGTPRTGSKQARAEAKAPHGRVADGGFKKILLLLRNHCGVDFSFYKSTTIQRRIARRMVLNKQHRLEDYARFLRGNAKELDALYSDALISVTSFFRNPEAFDILKRRVFPKLLRQRGDEPVRVWVLGCSTGQEAYSMAMAFVEAGEKAPRMPRLQVFATDLNDALLEKARHGLYAKSLAHDVSPERLRRFFVEEEGGYRVSKPLREMVVFARQNLTSDPPFSRMDVVSCRNLLIYLEPSLQKRLFPTFHYALKPEGFLVLGGSESIGGFTDLFEPLDRKHKIYSKKAAPTPAFHLPVTNGRGEQGFRPQQRQVGTSRAERKGRAELQGFRTEFSSQREADRVTLNQYAPPGVLVNAELQVLQFRGPTSAYLEPPTGKASFDVLKMAREGLMLPLRAAINKAKKQNKTARADNARVRQNGATRAVNMEVIPLRNLSERCFLILFEDAERPARVGDGARSRKRAGGTARTSRAAGKKEESRRVANLERELAETRDYLQSLQEQYEAANEELHASNEEVQSANEELQSVNEELETSKEELESTNEELSTVNEEMANRNIELSRLNSDLVNFQTSTRIAIVLLGRDLTIRRFSAQAEKQFNLLAADVGRPIGSLRHNLDLPGLEGFIAEVIASVREREQEARDKDGRWYSLRVRPYLTVDNKVDGAVLVLVDINDLKRSEAEVKAARSYAEAIIRTSRDPLVVLRGDLRVNTANEAFYKAFKTAPDQAEGRSIFELSDGFWRIPKLRMLLTDILPRNSFFNNFEVTHEFPHIGRRTMLLNARRLDVDDGSAPMILLAIEDVTERLRGDMAAVSLAAIVNSSDDAIIGKDLSGVIVSWNKGAERLFGYSAQEAIGRPITMLIPPERLHEEPEIIERIKRGEPVRPFETVRVRKDGSRLEISLTVSPIKDATGRVIGASKIARDITERKEADQRQQFLMNELAHRSKNLLAVIQSIASRSLSGRASLTEAREVLMRRIQALGRSQSVLVTTGFEGAPVAELIRLELEAFSERVKAVGPDVKLNPRAAQTFALVLHELATNAVKHGALSQPAGQVAIQWQVEGAGAEARFKFHWQERDGPAVVPPTHQGFGRVLLERAVAHDFAASPTIRFAPDGLSYGIDAPLSVVVA
jgi:two-component system CheB/CheR fusion protein